MVAIVTVSITPLEHGVTALVQLTTTNFGGPTELLLFDFLAFYKTK